MLYMVTFTINIPPMLAYIPYMDPMGNGTPPIELVVFHGLFHKSWVNGMVVPLHVGWFISWKIRK